MRIDGFIDDKSGLRLRDLKIEDDLKKIRYDGKICPSEDVLPSSRGFVFRNCAALPLPMIAYCPPK